MAVNPDIQGRSYPPGEPYSVSREVIRNFAEATKATHPAYTDVAAARELGYDDLLAPPTFAVIIAQRSDARLVRDPEAGIDFSRVVHGSQQFIAHRPIIAGDKLVAELHVDSIRLVGGNAMVTTRSEIMDADSQEKVVTAISALVVRGDDA
ncbi:MaoC family dehydratase N-terminal domain-containing protein [Saxibacter everestensis]|uniref:UPF0336 protein LWF01_12510 n=1 Tax=Saxibacter everestensis TaxID=2909229 RepID=A0ABY8QPP3_9MICO|nr:MaoC family dehydratase N-terminal domain-containing protein [Brevibacteriaceae bacterium ZFBP1038]